MADFIQDICRKDVASQKEASEEDDSSKKMKIGVLV